MIMSNDFRKWQDTAEIIDQEQYYVNLYLRRIKENEYPSTPYTSKGIIYIDKPADKNEGYFGGILAHESNHMVHDPITFFNYFNCIQEIKKRLDTKDKMENLLANVASDLIIEYNLSKNPLLKDYSRKSYEFTMQNIQTQTVKLNEEIKKHLPDHKGLDTEKPQGEMMAEFVSIIAQWHGFKAPITPKYYDKVMKIIKSNNSREKKYVQLAAIFKPLYEKDQKNMPKYIMQISGKGADGKSKTINIPMTEEEKQQMEKRMKLMPINPGKEDMKDFKKKTLEEAKTAEEAREKLKAAKQFMKDHDLSPSRDGHFEIDLDDKEVLEGFYNAKAEQVLVSIDFPRMPVRKGLEVSHTKWRMGHGIHALDVTDTIMKKGINIPTVTSLTPKIIPKFISDIKQTKPLDLIISVDTSGSTGIPDGSMQNQADFEVTLLFAILKMARKIDQKIGMMLWTTQTYYTVPPQDRKNFDELIKKAIFSRWSSGGTNMDLALKHAIKNPNELHFVFTDGYVFDSGFGPEELKERMKKLQGRIHFFLVATESLKQFQEACGKDSVTDASDLDKLPRVGLNTWKNTFWRK